MKNVLIICGGRSAEHEISILSAQSIIGAIDRLHFKPIPVVISRSGTWYHLPEQALFEIKSLDDESNIGHICTLMRQPSQTVLHTDSNLNIKIDMAFPLVHGPMGEDGTLQGLLELMSLPYVGSGVLASAIGMDKDTMKSILANCNLPVAPFVTITRTNIPQYHEVCKQLNSTILFIKPSLMGSSVGISKVKNKDQYLEAIQQAFHYDHKVLIEKFIPGREVECSVLGNDNPIASVIGEIKPNHEFYSYEAKYLDAKGADLIIPAIISDELSQEIQQLAIATFQAIGCKGYARVDFFITENQKVYVNELNSIPGFTSISMYPKMLEATGIGYTELISKLLNLGFESYLEKQSLSLKPDIQMRSEDVKRA